MREGIHPAYYQAKVTCNCGNEFVTGSTKEEIHVEVCSNAILSTPVSRKLLLHAVVSISSTRNTALRRKHNESEVRLRLKWSTLAQPYFSL